MMRRYLATVVLMLSLLSVTLWTLSSRAAAADGECGAPAPGQHLNLTEGSFAGMWGEVLNIQRKGSADPIMVLRLSDGATLAIVEACQGWTPSAGLLIGEYECAAPLDPGDPTSPTICTLINSE